MKKVVISCRISSDDQSHFSISYQEEVLRKYCERMNYQVVEVITDDVSAKTFNRPGYISFKNKIKTIRNYCDLFLILRWDRFSRNAFNAMYEIRQMAKYGVDVFCHDQPVDLSTPDGKMMLAIYLISPEIENDKNSLRTSEGMHKAKSQGNLAGRAPMGYINYKDENERALIKIDEAKAKFVLYTYEAFAYHNISKAEIAAYLRKQNLIGAGRDQVTRILRNPVYAGKVSVPPFKGEPRKIVNGIHEPIVSEELFNTVQQILDGKKRPQKQRASELFPLRGILHCDRCDAKLTASVSRNRFGTKYAYYHCRSACGYRVSADVINNQMEALMRELQLSAAFAETYKLVLKDVFQEENIDVPKQISQSEAELNKTESMITSLDEKYLLNQITTEDYQRILKNMNTKKFNLQQKLHDLNEFMSSFNKKLVFSINALKNLGEEYVTGNAITKKNIVSSTFPEKLVFSKNTFRTSRLNSLIFANARKYEQKQTAMQSTAVQKLVLTSDGVLSTTPFELLRQDLNLIFNAFAAKTA